MLLAPRTWRASSAATGRRDARPLIALRRHRLCVKHVFVEASVSSATVSRVRRTTSLCLPSTIELVHPVRRYMHQHHNKLMHSDIETWSLQQGMTLHKRGPQGPVQ